MHRTPPRRSSRLNAANNTTMNTQQVGLPSINEESTNSPANTVPARDAAAAAATCMFSSTPASDETVVITDSNAAGAYKDTTMSTPTSEVTDLIGCNNVAGAAIGTNLGTLEAIDLRAIEKRIAMLESQLKATQIQLRERDSQNESLRAVLQSNGSSAITYASSVVTQSQAVLPPSTQAEVTAPSISGLLVGESRFTTPYSAAHTYSAMSQPILRNTAPAVSTIYSAFPMNNTLPTQSSNTSIPVHSANSGWMHGQYSPHSSYYPRKLLDLPEFNGRPEDWPVFYTAFMESTSAYGYSDFDNNQRLLKCLKGDARETVKSLLIHPCNVSCIIEQLKFRFGRPELLIKSQLQHVKEIMPISEHALSKLIPFATKVKNICAFLKSADADHHLANPTLIDELISKLPMTKRIEWGRYAASVQPRATVVLFSDWLTALANIICTIHDENQFACRDQKRRVVLHVGDKQQSQKCYICQGQHKSADCASLVNATVAGRWSEVKSRRLCFTCLNAGHTTRDCRQRKLCSIDGCKRVHHRLLHETQSQPPPAQSAPSMKNSNGDTSVQLPQSQRQQVSSGSGAAVLSCASSSSKHKLLLRILPVTLYGRHSQIDTYALLDDGSSVTMLDDSIAKELGLRGRPHHLSVQWFGGHTAKEQANLVDLSISGLGMTKRHKLKNVYSVQNLQLPMQSLSSADLQCEYGQISQLPLQPHAGAIPRLLIGIDNCHLGLASTTIAMKQYGPFAANTELGWVVFGPTGKDSPVSSNCLLVNSNADRLLHDIVADFFEVESFGVRAAPPVESEADVRARTILEATTRRVGIRFQTGLLWKRDEVQLPNSYGMAINRLVSVEKRMYRDVCFATSYKQIIQSYITNGYARKLTPSAAALTTPRTWYLPHFGVVNPNKPSKLRLVFDAAAEVHGVSLNRHLLKGPQEYRPLPAILFNFRERAVGVSGDIKEMFHQVLIREEDRCAQRFLWRDGDSSRQPDVFEMCVMTFGAACSPSAAHYIKIRNAIEHRNDNPITTRAIKSIVDNHYVDDFVDSFDTTNEAIAIAKQVKAIHMDAGFELRNFMSSSPEVSAALGGIDVTKILGKKEDMSTERVLGLHWCPTTDCFSFSPKFNNVSEAVLRGDRRPTKRELLSVVMSIFDPLGLLANFVVGAKLVMREAWRHETNWDDPLPQNIADMWEMWHKQLQAVTKYAIPRFYFKNVSPRELQLHVFVDASENAFASVAYWRATNSNGEVEVSFICAKSKCAPLKPLSVPRLELQAAVLGTRLAQTIRAEHNIKFERCILWSDSKTVISWVRSKHRRYKPFVQHRIAEILAATNISDWKWVSTQENVADEATRFNHKVDFSPAARWLCGPTFLRQQESMWPNQDTITITDEDCNEELRPRYTLVTVSCEFINFNRFSSFNRLLRTTAWVIRFVAICRRRRLQVNHQYGLTSGDLQAAKHLLCRLVQSESFNTEISQIRSGQGVSSNSTLVQLSPYIDSEGLLRVHGRIDAASWLPVDTRHPLILPPTHMFTKLLVMHHHILMGHQNIEATICSIRVSFWVPRLRRVLRSVIASCLVCRIRKTSPAPPLMGPLPIDRVTPYVRPFTYTGLDYFGPLNVTVRRSTEKRWVALFTCLTVRAVHLELAHDLSTDACIVAIRNFVNRRGVPIRMRSDNGKNFVGVNNEATRFNEVFDCERIQGELSQRGVDWVFNSPFNPSEGGAWERMVQCVKRVLRHTLKEVAPREHTLNCLLIEAENIINSRPLTHLPVTADQEQPLTPNDFLLGSPNTAQTPKTADIVANTCALRQQWRIARQLRDHLWKRWVAEYLPPLTRRTKWCKRTKPMEKGDLVFICDPNVQRKDWCRGIVEEVYPGRDGEVRQADVRTSSGLRRRAVSKLAILDVIDGESSRSTGVGMS